MKLPKSEVITYATKHGPRSYRGYRLSPAWALVYDDGAWMFVFLPTGVSSSAYTAEQAKSAIEHIADPPPYEGALDPGDPVPAEQVAWFTEAMATMKRIGVERAQADGLKLYKARVTRACFVDRWVLAKDETHAASLAERAVSDDDFDVREADTYADAWAPRITKLSAYEGDDDCVVPDYLGHMRLPEANALAGSPLTIAEHPRKAKKNKP